MGFIRSHMVRVFIAVFILLFCDELAYRVEGNTVKRFVDIGGDITLSCYLQRNIVNYNSWNRNGTLLANKQGISIDDHRITQRYEDYEYDQRYSYYGISIADADIIDSATYNCSNVWNAVIVSYDVHVIGCSNCIITTHSNQDKKKVYCNLDNYWDSKQQFERNITLNGGVVRTAVIQENVFSFPINIYELSKLDFKFYLAIETSSRITCMLSTQLTTSQPSAFHSTTTSKPTTLKQITHNRRSTSTSTASQELSPIPIVINNTPLSKNANTDNNKNRNIPIILGVIGSSFLLIIAVIICVLRYGSMKKRNQDIPKQCETSDSEENQTTTDNMMSIEGTSSSRGPNSAMYMELLKENREHVDNIPHDYTYVTPTESSQNETSRNHTHAYDMAEYVNNKVKHQPKRKGASPRPEDRYDDVLAPELGDHPKRKEVSPRPEEQYDDVSVPKFGDDSAENTFYSDIK